jgi:hypothetical protein
MKQSILFFIIMLLLNGIDSNAQVNRIWDYTFDPISNYEASGNSITVLPSGKAVGVGVFRNSSVQSTKNALICTDENGNLFYVDTMVLGAGFKMVLYDGFSNLYAAATLNSDTLSISKLVVAKFDTGFSSVQYFVPDSGTTSPGYNVLYLTMLSNGNIAIASRWDAFPYRCLSLYCLDPAGNVLWERVDSSFQFGYNVRIIADSSGGLYAAGSGRDTSNSDDFIFITHLKTDGASDWTYRYYSPAQIVADMRDIELDITGHLYIAGNVMDTAGQVGILMKLDTLGNVLWNNPVSALAFTKICTDYDGNIYGAAVPLNGIDVYTIEKFDSAGTSLSSSAFQLSGYFASELGDLQMLNGSVFVATGGLFVWSVPVSDQFLVAMDTSLNVIGYDIFDSLNGLGEKAHSIAFGINGDVYVCGRVNYEDQFETSNIGIAKYEVINIINKVSEVNKNNFEVYPNPSQGEITFRWDHTLGEQALIKVFDNKGVEVFHAQIKVLIGQKSYRLNLETGLYHATIETDQGRMVKKICILN